MLLNFKAWSISRDALGYGRSLGLFFLDIFEEPEIWHQNGIHKCRLSPILTEVKILGDMPFTFVIVVCVLENRKATSI